MKNECVRWKEQLREAALTGARSLELAEHLQSCAHCTAELKDLEARRARLDTLLPLVLGGSQPSADFRERALAAAEAASERKRVPRWRVWTRAGATAVAAIVLLVTGLWYRGMTRKIQPDELAAAQKLAEWRAPSDSLLATPGQEILRTTPKLRESFLAVPVKKVEEE